MGLLRTSAIQSNFDVDSTRINRTVLWFLCHNFEICGVKIDLRNYQFKWMEHGMQVKSARNRIPRPFLSEKLLYEPGLKGLWRTRKKGLLVFPKNRGTCQWAVSIQVNRISCNTRQNPYKRRSDPLFLIVENPFTMHVADQRPCG